MNPKRNSILNTMAWMAYSESVWYLGYTPKTKMAYFCFLCPLSIIFGLVCIKWRHCVEYIIVHLLIPNIPCECHLCPRYARSKKMHPQIQTFFKISNATNSTTKASNDVISFSVCVANMYASTLWFWPAEMAWFWKSFFSSMSTFQEHFCTSKVE